MQGVALALPLRTPAGKVLPGGRLQLYVHAGDGVRDLTLALTPALTLTPSLTLSRALTLTHA